MDKITKEIYVGDIDDFREPDLDVLDVMINLSTTCLDEREQLEHPMIHIPLRDGENEQLIFTQAVDTLKREIVRENVTVMVNCLNGKSRSITVTATALASINQTSLDKELANIEKSHPEANPRSEMVEQAKLYLGESL